MTAATLHGPHCLSPDGYLWCGWPDQHPVPEAAPSRLTVDMHLLENATKRRDRLTAILVGARIRRELEEPR
jgi:hypothetical protein